MPAYNFKTRFADAVENGDKCQTIRKRRKRPTRVGDTLYLYTGMRTKACRLLRTETCIGIAPIDIYDGRIVFDGSELPRWHAKALAEHDGFDTLSDFFEFFGLPIIGELELIEWKPTLPEVPDAN
jgi:hypothetical protein